MDDDGLPKNFKTFVQLNRKKFPLIVQVQEGIYGDQELDSDVRDFSCGDYLILQRVIDEVNVTFESFYDQPSHQGQITLPVDYDGNLEVLSRYPEGHVFTTAGDVIKDCVMYVYPQLGFQAQGGVVVVPGDRLRVLKKVTLPKGDYLLCMYVKEDRNILIPFDTKGHFEKRERYPECRLKDIIDRLPQRVRVVRDESMRVRGIGHGISGLPEDYFGDLLLSKVEFVEACLWDSQQKTIKIPCSINIDVKATPEMESKFGDVCDIHSLMRRDVLGKFSKIVIADDEENADKAGLSMDTTFKILCQRQEIYVLVESEGSYLLLPETFQGYFRLISPEFKTAIDLVESDCKERVRVTHAYVSADPLADTLYLNDEVKIHAKNLLVVPKIPNTAYEEHELVLLDRYFSTQGRLGLVKVPTYAIGCFQTAVSIEGRFRLNKVLQSKLPLTACFAGYPTGAQRSDSHLMQGSNVTFFGAHELKVIYVSLDDDANNNENECIRVVPEFTALKVRPLRPDLPPGSKGKGRQPEREDSLKSPDPCVIELDREQFGDILKKIEAANDPHFGTYVESFTDVNTGRRLPAPPPGDNDGYDQIPGRSDRTNMAAAGQRIQQPLPDEVGYETLRGQRLGQRPRGSTGPPPILAPSPGSPVGLTPTSGFPQGHRGFFEIQRGTSQAEASGHDKSTTTPSASKKGAQERVRPGFRRLISLPKFPFHFEGGTLKRKTNKKRSTSASGKDDLDAVPES